MDTTWLIVVVVVAVLAVVVIEVIAARSRTQLQQSLLATDGGAANQQQAAESSAAIAAEIAQARQRVEEILAVQRDELTTSRASLADRERQLQAWEVRLHDAQGKLTEEQADVIAARAALDKERAKITKRIADLSDKEATLMAEMERLSGITATEAKDELLQRVADQARQEAILRARDMENEVSATAFETSRRVLLTTIQRLAVDTVSESVVSTVELPNEQMKGRVIGREGRNIRAFEQTTGVNVLVDDTPGLVLLSCFDPVRRETARVALTELIADGRINPVRIEEVYARSVERVSNSCQEAATDALARLGITGMDPGLVEILGTLKYRTSYGQNVLAHMVECGEIAGMIAAELQLDIGRCKRAAFLHDIGKAVITSGEGSHAAEGALLARRFGEDQIVVDAIAAHHNEVAPDTAEAILTQIADSVSGSRPGARRESLEAYVQRLERLESIATSHSGVEKAFALQAGREIRVMVFPDEVDEADSWALAHDIAREIEAELTYPGNIKVTVVRETRAGDTAH